MSEKPWEDFKKQPQDSKPWEDFAGASIAAANPAAKEEIPLEEEPKDVSLYDRMLIQNLNNDPSTAVDYLKKNYPQYKEGISFDPNSKEITFTDPKTARVMPLNPHLGFKGELTHPSELLKDVGGNVVPVAQGLAAKGIGALSGLGAAGASVLAGQPELAPAAARTGYIGGEAGANAGLEALKQKLGQYLGVNKEVNMKDVRNAGIGGAADALLFGGSTLPASELTNYVGPEVSNAVESANQGIVTKALPYAYSGISGIPVKTIKTGQQKMGQIKELENSSDPTNQLGQMVQNSVAKVEAAREKVGSGISNAIKNHEGGVSLVEAQKPWLDRINTLEQMKENEGLTDLQQGRLADLKSKYNEIFGDTSGQVIPKEVVDPVTLQKSTISVPSKAPAFDSSASARKAFDLKQRLKEEANLPLLMKGGKTSEIEQLAAQSGGALSSQLEKSVPGLDELNPQYESISRLLDSIGDKSTNTRQKAFNLIQNLASKNKTVTAEDLDIADKTLGTNFTDTANLVDAFNTFRNNGTRSLAKRELATRIPAAGVGGALGYYAGSEEGGSRGWGALGGALGLGVGAKVGAPGSVRNYINLGNYASKFTPITEQAPLPVWNMIQSEKEQKRKNNP